MCHFTRQRSLSHQGKYGSGCFCEGEEYFMFNILLVKIYQMLNLAFCYAYFDQSKQK